jgi:hypothetical protein
MKLFGFVGAILVIAGFISLTAPMLSAENGVHARPTRTLNHLEQYGGGAAILIGLALVGLDVVARH